MTTTESAKENKTDVVEIKSGKIQGIISKGINIFKGIPYATSPIGELRFCPPEEIQPWDGLLDASQYGPYAIQGESVLEALLGKPPAVSEADCLTLNVWTPGIDVKKRPVMVWIHGGAFVNGSGALPIYSGLALALKGDVVVVTINYRLGALGYLYVPGVTANVGQLDQIAALEWVRDNIETFGGDPGNVTIFGESAGGMAVITLLAMPAARGLFHRIISQSGPFFDPRPNEKTSKMLFRKLNLKNGNMEGLRAIEVEKIKKAQDEIRAQNPKELLEFSPRIDGDTLPMHPLEALKNGAGKDMELLIGCTLEESKLFTALNPAIKKMKDDELKQIAFDYLSNADIKKKNQEKLYELYAEAKQGHSLFDIMNTIITDQLFRLPAIRYAEQQLVHQPNVYMYTYTWASPALKGQLGACHAIELAFVFGTLKAPRMDIFFGKGPDAENLSEKTMDAWLAFAKTGNPNHDGIPEWPAYDIEKRLTMFLGKEIEVIEKPFDVERAGWEDL